MPTDLRGIARWAFLVAAITGLATRTVSALPLHEVVVGPDQASTKLVLKRGDSLVIRLPVSMGTGSRWFVAHNGDCISGVVTDDVVDAASQPGAPQTQQLTFHPRRVGNCTIQLVYRRAFDEKAAPFRRLEFQISVKDD